MTADYMVIRASESPPPPVANRVKIGTGVTSFEKLMSSKQQIKLLSLLLKKNENTIRTNFALGFISFLIAPRLDNNNNNKFFQTFYFHC